MHPRSLYLAALSLALPASLVAADMPWETEWIDVANHLVVTQPATFPYNWGEGVQAIGMMKIYEQTENDVYADWVGRWLGIYIPKGMDELLLTKAPPKQLPDYCGHWAPATAAFYLYQVSKKPEHLRLALDTAEFITKKAGRSPDGGLDHWRDKKQLWVDTLYMACPLLAALAKPQSKPAYLDDAIQQILV